MKLWLGGEDKVDGRLLALLRVMYCRDRRLLALSNVTYASLQAYNTPFRIATFERRAIMHALVHRHIHITSLMSQSTGPRPSLGGMLLPKCLNTQRLGSNVMWCDVWWLCCRVWRPRCFAVCPRP